MKKSLFANFVGFSLLLGACQSSAVVATSDLELGASASNHAEVTVPDEAAPVMKVAKAQEAKTVETKRDSEARRAEQGLTVIIDMLEELRSLFLEARKGQHSEEELTAMEQRQQIILASIEQEANQLKEVLESFAERDLMGSLGLRKISKASLKSRSAYNLKLLDAANEHLLHLFDEALFAHS